MLCQYSVFLRRNISKTADKLRLVFSLSHTCKAKAVPLHATKALEEIGGIAPTHSRPLH
jgi:hypothetical protein